jgi:hypothetical protein
MKYAMLVLAAMTLFGISGCYLSSPPDLPCRYCQDPYSYSSQHRGPLAVVDPKTQFEELTGYVPPHLKNKGLCAADFNSLTTLQQSADPYGRQWKRLDSSMNGGVNCHPMNMDTGEKVQGGYYHRHQQPYQYPHQQYQIQPYQQRW